MTIFALSTSKNSPTEITAAAVTINNRAKFGRTTNSLATTTTTTEKNKNKLETGNLSAEATAVATDRRSSQSNTMERQEKEHQIGLVPNTNKPLSVMNPLTCGEVPVRHRTYNSSNIGHQTRALGMILFLIVVISSTSSVLCVPLEHPELTGSFLPTKQRQQSPYVLESKGQMYLPSILNPPQDERNDPDINNPMLHFQENEDESIGSDNEWETVIDPHFYVLTEWNSKPILEQQRTRRNAGQSLSIVNPLDVLRQRLLLEIARRRMRVTHQQIMQNAEMLKNIGRRK